MKQDKVAYNHGQVVNILIVYEKSNNFNISIYTTLENCLFGVVTLKKKVGIDNYKYSGYGIRFYIHGFFSHPSGGTGRNVVIFGVVRVYLQRLIIRKKIS